MIGRTSFVGDLLYSLGVSGFIYPIIGHWAWGPDGFLVTIGTAGNFLPGLGMGFHDFAGSTVVHTIGGFVALAGAIAFGPPAWPLNSSGTAAAPCYWVSPAGSIIIGAVAGVIVVVGVDILERLRIDDPIGAVPGHGLTGYGEPFL